MNTNRKVSVVGLGYVGLPVAVAFGKLSETIGFDINAKRIEDLRAGIDRNKDTSEEDLKKFNDLPEDQRPKSAFQKVDKPLKKEKILPKEIFFTKFETINRKEPITTGTVYIHFSPEGLVEQSALFY